MEITEPLNLGQVQALHIGAEPPQNKALIWFDAVSRTHKVYDFNLNQWILLKEGFPYASYNITLTANSPYNVNVLSTPFIIQTYEDNAGVLILDNSIVVTTTGNTITLLSNVGKDILLKVIL